MSDTYPPHDLEFSGGWSRGHVHSQTFRLPIDPALPAGLYWLSVELYDYATGWRVPAVGGRASAVTRLPIEWQKAVDPSPPDGREPVGRFEDGIALQRLELTRMGDALDVALDWRAEARPTADYTVFVHLYDPAGDLVGQHDAPPAPPTWAWEAGDAVHEHHRIRLPSGGLPEGATLKVGLYLPSTGQRLRLQAGGDGVSVASTPLLAADGSG